MTIQIKRLLAHSLVLFTVPVLFSCSSKQAAEDEEHTPEAVTPVTITHIITEPVSDTITLNATSVFLQKNYVKANAIGYVEKVNVKPGQYVQKGQLLFIIKTKEAQSIGNTINSLDKNFRFTGVNHIRASEGGYISQLNHQLGDYVQDGEQLAIISDHNSFAFLVQVPYELHRLIAQNQNLRIDLPDGTKLPGHIASIMPTVDTLAQTQGLVVKVNGSAPLPENLVAKARLIKAAKTQAPTLPKSAVLANETLTEFWVMKLINDSTAVKTPVKKGIETGNRIEIVEPVFKSADRIIETGNYGLADTAKIKITKL
ncbi:HlyD family efflux transporter periplasmic adaptor subunit [Mucilaginibacter sp. 44-25]|uniref:efflux RND transporter periplasmic adaptor subunit n=1 Tax=Mucilaginibacter sp. 44-25 TaxID=1895794 RepID=UPI0009590441|nr:HlyD family efflux transporter periplasmic adaptor subunit [Mucilaginibacter sp. 44-25]OJW16868.1 MAG: RND transporter [Mucilaginibacter sp. 44-25]HEK21848.1 HlyD family efflux transporter periplasmic adaptor subunit [Bacteroidota bacterium]